MHRTSNYLTHRACTELSRRGFLMLCMNSRFENNEPAVDFEKLPLDVKQGVAFLRKQPGITKVVLFAHSGGGPIMALYQAVAEKGTAYCKGENKLTQCVDDLAGLPPIDGIVFTDAHPGNAINLLRGINPSVANENNPPDAPPVAELDPFNPANGFNPNGPSNYSVEFQSRYFRAQADRMNRLIDVARDKLDRMKRNAYPYPDDDVIVIPRGGNPGSGPGASAALFIAQPSIAAVNSTSQPARLLRNDGSITEQVIKSVYVADPKLSRDNLRFSTGTKIYTLRSFLSANAIRAKHAIDDIDFCSTNNSTVCAVQSITRSGAVRRDGRALLHPRQRAHVRARREQGQGLHHHRRRGSWFHTVHALRDDARAVFQLGQEPLRLHCEVAQRPLPIGETAPATKVLAARCCDDDMNAGSGRPPNDNR